MNLNKVIKNEIIWEDWKQVADHALKQLSKLHRFDQHQELQLHDESILPSYVQPLPHGMHALFLFPLYTT